MIGVKPIGGAEDTGIHVPGKKPERGWCSDVVWVLVPEVHELVVEGGPQLVG